MKIIVALKTLQNLFEKCGPCHAQTGTSVWYQKVAATRWHQRDRMLGTVLIRESDKLIICWGNSRNIDDGGHKIERASPAKLGRLVKCGKGIIGLQSLKNIKTHTVCDSAL